MFDVEPKTIQYNLTVSEDIVEFCQWAINEDKVLDDVYDVIALLDAIANQTHYKAIRNNEINIRYE